jgi:hypothetical protein
VHSDAEDAAMQAVYRAVRADITCGCPHCSATAEIMLAWYLGPDRDPDLRRQVVRRLATMANSVRQQG